MKKVAIVLDSMSIGGIPKACAAFVRQLVEYCDVTMIMRRDDGELMDLLPGKAHVKVVPHGSFRTVFRGHLAARRGFRLIKFAVSYLWWTYLCKRWVKSNEILAKETGVFVDDEYDCVMAFHGMSIHHLVTALYNVKADKKIAWIHGDHPFSDAHKIDAGRIYEKFDKIYCGSNIAKNKFLSDFPGAASITDTYYCYIDTEDVKKKSTEFSCEVFQPGYFNILTVGRLSQEKGQDLIPETVRRLKENGYKIKWFLIGDGDDKNRIEELIHQNNVCGDVVLLGAMSNPFPFMKECDLYVQPSYSECYSLTVFEALSLGKIVLCSDVAGASELLTSGEEAIFSKPTVDCLVQNISMLIDDCELRYKIVSHIHGNDYSSENEVIKVLKYLDIEE